MLKTALITVIVALCNLLYAQKSNYAVEVAAFAQPVDNGHFKDIAGVYETLDGNYIYRYYLDANDLEDAQTKQKKAVNAGFVNARVINFENLRSQCDVSCQYIAPKATGNKIAPFVPKKEITNNITNLRCIFFDFDRYFLREDAKEELNRLAIVMRQQPTCTVDLNGHTDAKGSQAYNTQLAKNRTATAKKYLVKLGIAAHRIAEKTYGEKDPIAINNYSDGQDATVGRQYNRRVDFTLRDQQGKIIRIVDKIRVPDNLQQN